MLIEFNAVIAVTDEKIMLKIVEDEDFAVNMIGGSREQVRITIDGSYELVQKVFNKLKGISLE